MIFWYHRKILTLDLHASTRAAAATPGPAAMGEAAASTMGIRRTEKAAPPPTGRRQRSSSSPTPAAWPAFPIESSNNAAVGLGLGRSSPAGSPSLSSTSEVSVGAKSGASRSNSAGPRSPLMIRKKSYCCNSCRPTPASDRHQRQQAGKNGGDIAYDDVFGGPPKYLQNDRKMSIPGYDEVCWSSKSSSPRLSKTKSRPAELPVFDPPAYNTEVFRGSPADRPKSPTPAAEIAYDDVFGGPVSGPRPRILKDLLKCSTSESKSPLSESSYRSPASVHSTSKESTHANPIYEFETEAVQISKCGGRNVSGKSSQTYVECEIFRYGYKKPIGSSVSSSPFTEHYDDSAMNSYSTKISKSGATLGDYEEVCRKPPRPHSSKLDCETTSSNQTTSSDSELSEIEYTRRRFSKGAGRRSKGRQSFNYVRRGSRARSEIDKGSPFRSFQGDSPEAEFFIKSENGTPHKKNDKVYGSKADKNLPPEQDLNFKDSSHSSALDSVTAIGQEVTARQEVSFVTVDRVKLKTEPTNGRPPRRPAPSPQNSIGNTFEADSEEENEISELLESEAFMEYSIKDLDGLVAEEYSVSESSPSASNSTKTRSCPSHDDDDSNMDVEPPESVFSRERSSARQTEAERESELKQKDKRIRSSWTAGNTVENSGSNAHVSPKVDNLNAAEAHITSAFEKMMKYSPAETSKSNLQEPASSSSSSPGEKLQAPDWSTVSGETPERRKSRLERQQRDVRRVAKALDEKKRRELEIEQQQAEKHRVGEILEDVVKRWAAGKQGNLRALVSTLQYILWPDCGWQPVSLSDIIEPVAVRKSYRKATLFVHPDKVQQKGATVEQKYIAEKVFDLLQEAWAVFNYEQLF